MASKRAITNLYSCKYYREDKKLKPCRERSHKMSTCPRRPLLSGPKSGRLIQILTVCTTGTPFWYPSDLTQKIFEWWNFRSSRQKCSMEKGVLETFAKFTGNLNFVKFWRTAFLQTPFYKTRLLLKFQCTLNLNNGTWWYKE